MVERRGAPTDQTVGVFLIFIFTINLGACGGKTDEEFKEKCQKELREVLFIQGVGVSPCRADWYCEACADRVDACIAKNCDDLDSAEFQGLYECIIATEGHDQTRCTGGEE